MLYKKKTLYRLAHECSFSTVADLFGVSISIAGQTFDKVTRVLVARLYDTFVVLPKNQAQWETELKNFIENYEFPCIGAWNGFHVYVCSKLKSYFGFKKRYTVSNLALVGFNKRILYAAVGAVGSTLDARMLKNTQLYQKILEGHVIPKLNICLEGAGTVLMVTIGGSAFPRHSRLLKSYKEDTMDPQQKYFHKKLWSACFVTENDYEMLKRRWRNLYKQTECRMYNLKYVIMSSIMSHNLCFSVIDPCKS